MDGKLRAIHAAWISAIPAEMTVSTAYYEIAEASCKSGKTLTSRGDFAQIAREFPHGLSSCFAFEQETGYSNDA